jgi:hypothetical protein
MGLTTTLKSDKNTCSATLTRSCIEGFEDD